MNLLAIKTFLKKAYVLVKNYWYVPLGLLVTAITWFFYRQKAEVMVDNLKKTREAHKKEIDVINDAHKKEAVAKDKAINKFVENNKMLEEHLEERVKVISAKIERRKSEHGNKEIDELARAIADSIAKGKK